MNTWRPSPKELRAARDKTIPDVITGGLDVIFCGINPSLYSAAVGHHFARPGNRFWPTLHGAAYTDRLLSPFEDRLLLDFGCGLTNMAARATARADELSVDELEDGAHKLEKKLKQHRPGCIAFLGITAYRSAFGRPKAVIGRQKERIADVPVSVLPNPSGLNAHYQLPELVSLYRELRG